jgi:hypothetical protein
MAVSCRSFCTDYRSYLQGLCSPASWNAWPLEMGPTGCSETSVINCHYTMRKVLQGPRSHLHADGRLKLRKETISSPNNTNLQHGATPKFKRLRWSRGCVLAFSTQVRGFKPGRSRRIFQGGKILSTTSFGGEVKPPVPCRRFAACKRSLLSAKLPEVSRPTSCTFRC